MRRILCLVTIALVLLPATAVAAIQNVGTPTAFACETEPLTPAELDDIVSVGFESAPALEATGDHPPATALLAIFDVLSDSLACTNANQPMSALSLFTNRYLAERFAGPDGADELGHLLAAATRSPAPATPEDQLVLIAVTDLILYTDGRVGAEVTTANVDAVFTDQIVFVETADGWKIDQVILGEDDPADGTPSASSQDS